MRDEFRSWRLTATTPSFEELVGSVRFDHVTNGRRGAVIVKAGPNGIPIVRTTTSYRASAQLFRPIHAELARTISESGSLPATFNNALVEHYTNAYTTMKRHSDQAQDLADASFIAVYSCYREPELPSRRLIVQPKGAGARFEVPLDHGSVVVFSLDTNRLFTHAITLRTSAPQNDWFGITFRTSKTLLRFVDGRPTLPSGVHLTLASEDQRRELFQLRRRENEEPGFVYPSLSYTLSESDLVPPRAASEHPQERELHLAGQRLHMAIPDDALNDVYDHVGGTELSNKSATKAIGHESEFVKEQVVLALRNEARLQPGGDIVVNVTEDEIVLTAGWASQEQRALAERIAHSLAVGRSVRSEPR